MSYPCISPLSRFLLLLMLSMGIMIIGHSKELLKPIRIVATIINLPFEFVIALPQHIFSVVKDYYPHNSMRQHLVNMQQKQAILRTRLQRHEYLEEENQRLSKLLSISKRLANKVVLAEIIEFELEPFRHRIVINRGTEAGIYRGQPAISPQGVLGQVSDVGYFRSVIILITDPSHGLPVQIERNGLRTIIQGSGKPDQVTVPFLENPSDIHLGDILVTSGMGGRFPGGYKVAEISAIIKDASQAFMTITAKTIQVGRAKEVLLFLPASKRPESGDSGESTVTRTSNE